MRKIVNVLVILIVGVLTLGLSQSRETSLALEEYKQILAENKSYRSYGSESGLKGNTRYQFTDEEGYRWYSSNNDGYKIYRFNGVRVNDVISDDKTASNDTMLPILIKTKTSHNVYASGMRNLYLWQDYSWKKYAFPAHDQILRMLYYDEDVYCIGEQGIGTLVGGVWKYRPFKTRISEAEAALANISRNGNLYVVSKTNPLTATISLEKYTVQKTSKVLLAYAQNYSDNVKTCFDYHNSLLWIYETDSDLLLKYDLRNDHTQKISLEPGTLVHSIVSTDNAKNWLITNSSGIVQAQELLAAFPKARGKEYSSGQLAFSSDRLDFLYLEGQVLPYSSQDQSAEGNRYAFIRILEANDGQRTLQIKELANPFGESICNHVYYYGKLLFMDLKHDKFQDVSHVLITKYPFTQISTRDIIIDSETYQLAYNEKMDTILNQRSGKVSMIPLVIVCEEIYQAPSHGQQKNYISINPFRNYQLLSFKGVDKELNKLYLLALKSGYIQELFAVENASLKGIDEGAALVYYQSRSNGTTDALYTYSLKDGHQELLESLEPNDRFFSFPGGYCVFNGDQIKVQLPSKPKETVAFLAFNRIFMTVLQSEKAFKWTKSNDALKAKLLDAIDYTSLGEGWMGATTKKLTLDKEDIIAASDAELNKVKISDLPPTTRITRNRVTHLNIPAHIFNLNSDAIELQPFWVRFYQQKNKHFLVGHLEKLPKNTFRYRISQFSKGKLVLGEDDFTLNPSGGYVPNVTAFLGDEQPLFTDFNNLYYRYNKAWQRLDLSQFEAYGKLGNVTYLDDVLWLCFDGALLRFDPKTKVTYAYTSQEGIPDKMESIFVDNGKLMIKTNDKIYKFNEYTNPLKLDIPYIIVSDSLKISVESKIVLPYKQRHIQIPVSILGPLYPELCQVSYRLVGYNDDWIVEDYLGIIKYAKLPYGKYVFEIIATSANGIQTPVKRIPFRIKPPWYSAWFAIVIYVLAGLGLVYLFYRWRLYQYREDNRQLEKQVQERTHELQEWQLRMTQSIDYALLIQKSILPQEEQLRRLFKDYFLIWQPRDVVGGDFYWLNELADGNSLLFAVIDCTGHGVPGALVSMTVNAALNHIVKEHGVNDPAEILQRLHEDIGKSLHQESEKSQQDGLDIALIKLDYTAKTLNFAGAAMNILVYEQNSHELIVLKGSKYSIGGLKHRKVNTFESQQISYSPNSKVYMNSDGILDQTNEVNVRMKRLGPEQWYKMLREIGDKPLPAQKVLMEEMISQMLLLDNQRDDITIAALQL